ncbi:MAG: phosphoglucosamine mutase, partial [Eggerthellaceae bacterium]|nr:phosphoglucosamine mutase [Eggerthellaceae bacterium]
MARLFGTDGVRGVANIDLTCPLAFRLGQAAVRFQGPRIIVGKDTRLSGDMLEAAVCAGITSMGGTALLAGIIPTPAIALLTKQLECDGGIVISASHNPPEYNGIKLFDRQGFKLPDEVEDEIQAAIESGTLDAERPAGDAVGVIEQVPDTLDRYVRHAVDSVLNLGVDFKGLKIALDCGHGASCNTSPSALEQLGATLFVMNNDFNGVDINVECGSTNLDPLKAFVAEVGADVGIAHDGDADRVMLVDAQGNEIDGDMMEAILALDMKKRGALPNDTCVSTVMCNLGFVRCMAANGIEVVQTKVGDRYVLEEMRAKGFAVGGEQSGHLILLDHNSTGDGLMTAVQFLAA